MEEGGAEWSGAQERPSKKLYMVKTLEEGNMKRRGNNRYRKMIVGLRAGAFAQCPKSVYKGSSTMVGIL